jgi:hypothetical protein
MVQQTDIYIRVPQLPGGFCDKIALPYSPECPPNPLPSVPLLATQKIQAADAGLSSISCNDLSSLL